MTQNNCFRVLIIEDDDAFAELLHETITELCQRVEITVTSSKIEAQDTLQDQKSFFDLIILDLKLPINQADFEKSPDHGMAILEIRRQVCPGTPVLILSGSTHESQFAKILKISDNVDIWGQGVKRQTIDHLPKVDVAEFHERILPIYEAVTSLSEIELTPKVLGEESLTLNHDRLLRIFIRHSGGIRAIYRENKSGLSSSKVYFLDLFNDKGAQILKAVAKCGSPEDITKEISNHNKHIIRLPASSSPRFITDYQYGAKDNYAVFYSMADDYISFFDVVKNGQLNPEILRKVRALVFPWESCIYEERSSIGDVRRELIGDETAQQLFTDYDLNWANDFEQNHFQLPRQISHGDMHGENILINTANQEAILIDYGDIKNAPAPIDPITLECSLLFHPSGLIETSWPSIEQLNNWENLDFYLNDCPCPDVIKFCRAWAESVSTGYRCIAACLYSYALRQLKYKDTDKQRALVLIFAARSLYERS